MSKVQERGLLDALGDAEGLARVLRTMSDGKLDLVPVLANSLGRQMPPLAVGWEQARTEARMISRGPAPSATHKNGGAAGHNPKAAEHDGYEHVGIPPHCPACRAPIPGAAAPRSREDDPR